MVRTKVKQILIKQCDLNSMGWALKGIATGTAVALICVIVAAGASVFFINEFLNRQASQNVGQEGNGGGGSTDGKSEEIVEFVYKPFNAIPYIDQNELSEADDVLSQISTFIDRYFSGIGPNADGCASLANPNSPTVQAVASRLVAFYPNNKEFQAKEIYYWVSNWISYDYGAVREFFSGTQREIPVQTIYDRTGVCVNYAVVLASLYEAAGFNAKIMVVWNGDWPWEWSDQHAIILLYLPGYPEYYQPFNDGWISLDATAGGQFGQRYQVHYEHYDTADV